MISLEDRLAIETLYSRNLWALDRGDADRFAATFTQEGRLHMRESHEGAGALQDFIRRVRAEDVAWPSSQHHMSSLLVEEASADVCLGQSYVMRVHRLPTRSRGNCQIIWSGYTLDRCTKADGKWRFAERRFRAWEGDIPNPDEARTI
jgi:hypothetical protein